MYRFNFWPYLPRPPQFPGMEYGPSPHQLPPGMTNPALMVFASQAESFNRKLMEEKAASNASSFNVSSLLRPNPNDNPFATPFPFFRPPLIQASGAFRPFNLEPESPVVISPKRAKTEEEDRPQVTPKSTHSSVSGEKLASPDDDALTDISEGTDRSTPDESRGRRKRKKPTERNVPVCPVCSVTMRPGEFQAHLEQELEKIASLSITARRSGRDSVTLKRDSASPNSSENRYQNFIRVRANRQQRQRAKAAALRESAAAIVKQESECPVCDKYVIGTDADIQHHVDKCLKKKTRANETEEVNVDSDGEGPSGSFEEYEWCGQQRIRATSLLQGSFQAHGFQVPKKEEEDVELDVDGDDKEKFGESQYNEADIVPCAADEPSEDRERAALREALLVNNEASSSSNSRAAKWQPDDLKPENEENGGEPDGSSKSNALHEAKTNLKIVESLKTKLREQSELLKKGAKSRCLICMDAYAQPLVSINCWHVHCEECWLRTLGVKKLCPQCNMITAPGDLRKIYL